MHLAGRLMFGLSVLIPLACAKAPESASATGGAGRTAHDGPTVVAIAEPARSIASTQAPPLDAGPAPESTGDAAPSRTSSKLHVPARCRIAGNASLDAWSEEAWRTCEVERCSEEGPLSQLRATVAAKTFATGVTDVARVTVENTTDSEVRVPFRRAANRTLHDPDDATLLKPDGQSYDAHEVSCLTQATCTDLVLEPHASISWNAIVVPMKRRSKDCEPLVPQSPLPPGPYTLRVRTHIDAHPPIEPVVEVRVLPRL